MLHSLPDGCSALMIPNAEIREIFETTVSKWFDDSAKAWNRSPLFDAVWSGNSEALTKEMTKLLRMTISYHDYREDFYHAFLAGIFTGAGYVVESNKEHGEGHSDVIVKDIRNGRVAIFEAKYVTSVENGPLFPNGKGGFWNEKNWRNRKFYHFLEEIGIQPNPYDENGKRKPEFAGKLATYTPYTTRHTYASLCDRTGVNKDILKRAVGHTPKSKTLDEVYLHPKATQMIEAFDKANQLVKDEVLALPEE